MAMKIVKAYPPNYPELREKFKIGGKTDVIFSYGDTIYNPGGYKLHRAIIAHEEAHGERQREIGVEYWWFQYVEDMRFRFSEEVIGHRAEWRTFLNGPPFPSMTQRRHILKAICERLSGPLYGHMCSYTFADAIITQDPCPPFYFKDTSQPELLANPVLAPLMLSASDEVVLPSTFQFGSLLATQVGA